MSKIDTGFLYDHTGYVNPVVQEGLDREIVKIIRDAEGIETVCDLGCGNGRLALHLGGLGYRVVGVDASSTGVAVAGGATDTRTAEFVCAEIDEHLPGQLLADRPPFDAVVSVDVVEHMFRPRVLVETAWSIVRPGGMLILCAPYHGYLKNLAISLLGKWDAHHTVHWDGGHIKFFSVATLTALVRENGWEVSFLRFFGRAPWLWKNMICVARKPR